MKKLACLLLVFLLLIAYVPSMADNGAVNWYEVFVRSYQDSDGDGIGDLQGLISRLDYIADMGWDGLWLMPVMPSPSYHKYDVIDYYDIDSEYGTLDDMRMLISEAHERGIEIIIDMVINHTSTQHPWFRTACAALREGKESPYIAYYNFQQHAESAFINVQGTDWYYEERFSGGAMPDLNLENEQVWEELRKIAAFWLNDMGVDGFRLDAVTSYHTNNTDKNVKALSRFKAICEELKEGSYLVGECWAGLSVIAEYYQSGIDSFFLFPASQAEGFIASSMRGRSGHAEKFAKSYQNVLEAIPEGILAPFLSNHDTGRTIGSVQGRSNILIAKFVEGVLNMMTGRVFTYYGEEIGMVGSGDDPNKRLAMYWSDKDMTTQPPGVTQLEYAYPSWEKQAEDPSSLLNYCKTLYHVRKAFPMIADGKNEFVYVDSELLLMRRILENESCLIAMNFSGKSAGSLVLNKSAAIAADIETGTEQAELAEDGLTLSLPPYGIVILTEGEEIK